MDEQPADDAGTHRSEQVGRPPRRNELVRLAFDDHSEARRNDVRVARQVNPGDTGLLTDPATDLAHERYCDKRHGSPLNTVGMREHLFRRRRDRCSTGGALELDDEDLAGIDHEVRP
jgi:hypothetical protein